MTAFPFFNSWTWAFVFLESRIQSFSSVYTFPCFYLCTLRRNWLHVPMLIDKKRISLTPEARSPSMKKADRGVQVCNLFCAPKTKIYMTEKDGYTLKKKENLVFRWGQFSFAYFPVTYDFWGKIIYCQITNHF